MDAREILPKRKEDERQKQWSEIQRSRYNMKYRKITIGSLSKYLKKRRKEGKQKLLTRATCNNLENVYIFG